MINIEITTKVFWETIFNQKFLTKHKTQMKTVKPFSLFFLLISFTSIFSQSQEVGEMFIQTLFKEKNYNKAYSFFDETIKSQVSEALLKETVEKLENQLGQFKTIIEINNEAKVFYYYSDFENMKLDIKITIVENDKITDFFFAPHKVFKTQLSLGKDFNVKSNGVELKGTLLIPEGNNQKKMIIFIHGSGPQDRDCTVAENKPFKDIAENLYQKGIASYRFDKRTLSYPETFNDKSTVDDEVVSDVLNIIHFFKNNPDYLEYEIVLLGHSLGAHLLPKIANQTNQINKIILLAGNARPLNELILEQYDYLLQLNPTDYMREEVIKIKKQNQLLKSKQFNSQTSNEELPLNLSATYWKSLLNYNPIKEIKKVNVPILILQGERDYQVSMKDFQLWKTALKKNKNACFISYTKLNHLFMTGESPSNPDEYATKGHVEEKVITDLLEFIKTDFNKK